MRQDKKESAAGKIQRRPPDGLQLALFGQRYGTDLHESVQGGTALKRRVKIRDRQNALFSNVPEIVWIKDRQGRFISASASFANACGVKHGDLIGKTDWDIWPRKLAERSAAQDRKVLSSGLPDRSTASEAFKTCGSKWSEIVKTPLFGRDGRIFGTLGIARDISAHKLAAGQLRLVARQVIRAREDEKKMISSFLHDELGSLIMLLNSSLVLAQQEVREDSPDAASRIEEAKKAARELAARLRNLCFEIRPPAMGVSGLAGAIGELAARAERCTAVKMQCSIRLADERKIDDLVKIMAYRIVQESLNNAIKHSGARTVKIRLHSSGDRLSLSVVDDGRGFDAQDPQFLKRNPTLGLRIMREEAESLYASLLVESTPGFGTVVKGDFPLNPAR